jgi:aryl sulfotransferase
MSVIDLNRPVLARKPARIYRDWACDSRHWARYFPRDGDVIIATAPKVGTTWMQQIVRLLILQDPAPRPLVPLSPWLDARFQIPLDVALRLIEAQPHRRFLKSHLPFDALPFYDQVQYIHVVRDGRDAAMSFCNHCASFTPVALALLDGIGLGDDTIGRTYPRMPTDLRAFFVHWLNDCESLGGALSVSAFVDIERSYWAERRRENLLLVHYNDLKADLGGEMRRVARFLGVEPPAEDWPSLVRAATFDQMKADGETLMAGAEAAFVEGHKSFLYKGVNGRWRDVLTEDDLQRYEARLAAELPPGLCAWIEHGRRAINDPRTAAD